MIAKLNDGFTLEVDDDVAEDQLVMDDLAASLKGDIVASSSLVLRVLGEKNRKLLYDHLKKDNGRVSSKAVGEAIGEIIVCCQAGKNSSASPN